MKKRILKRFRRENRPNKGVATEAARQAHNDRVRKARHSVGDLGDDYALLLASALLSKKR